jgi:catechol 2,3-dioxygenase-like lactoylglutathione lyase family enzyme
VIDHIKLRVANFTKSKSFYDQALEAIGMRLLPDSDDAYCAWSSNEDPLFEIAVPKEGEALSKGVHFCFKVKDKQLVHDFYKAALAAGGADNGEPGPRPHYSPTYYAAYVLDPDGNNVEVCLY